MAEAPRDEALEAARWDLEPLLEDGTTDSLLDEAAERSKAFAQRYRGTLAELDVGGLAEAMRELEAISERAGRAGSYASLWFSLDTEDAERGALMQRVRERSTELQTELLFFDLEWNQLPDDHVGVPARRPGARVLRPPPAHAAPLPPPPAVRARGADAHRDGGDRPLGLPPAVHRAGLGPAGGAPGRDEPVPLMQALSNLQDPDRERRRQAAEGVTAALEPGLRTRAFVTNTLAADKATKDRLRHYDHWLASRNLSNEASDESVEALVAAVQGRYDLARRWYRLKAKILGLDRLAHYDRMAPLRESTDRIPYGEAQELVLDCYRGFSPELGEAAAGFFSDGYIDGPPEPGKRGGAFCAYAVPSAHPYVLLNYTSRPGDVLTMAHELGHGVHAVLAQPQGLYHFTSPLTVAETASIFGETIVLERLLERAGDDQEARLALLAESLDGAVAAIFRQVAMNRFEHGVHTERRSGGELSVDRLNELWLETQTDLLGDSVELNEDYGTWWSYVPHFIDTPGYVYAYAYGHLLALSVYRRYEEEGEALVPQYLDLLRAGGSMPPEDLGRIVGVDLGDADFWDSGLNLILRQLEAAEKAASSL